MKANEFVKKHGWEAVIDAVKSTNAEETAAFESKDLDPILAKDGSVIGFNVKIHAISYVDVKRLVEAWGLVELFDDLDCAKAWVADLDADWPYQVKGSDNKFFKWQLEQAIADVESCKRLEVG